MVNGGAIDIATLCTLASTTVRLSQRLGLERRARNVTPSVGQYLANRTAPATGDAPDARGANDPPRFPLREALSDPNLLGTAIAGDSWGSWRTLLIAAMGEELSEDEREIFKSADRPGARAATTCRQFAAVIGREVASLEQWRRWPPTSQGFATTAMRWYPASVASCSASHSISGWRRSSSTTQRPALNVVRS